MMSLVSRLWDWVDARAVVRRAMLGCTMWMVWRSTAWSMEYAASSKLSGADIALVIGAATAPVVALLGYVFKVYATSRSE